MSERFLLSLETIVIPFQFLVQFLEIFMSIDFALTTSLSCDGVNFIIEVILIRRYLGMVRRNGTDNLSLMLQRLERRVKDSLSARGRWLARLHL